MIFEENLLKYVLSGRTFIDIGASEGAWCFRLRPMFERVIAFEPYPVNWQAGSTEIYNEVLSDKEKDVFFHIYSDHNCSGYVFNNKKKHVDWVKSDVLETIKANTKTLDSYNFTDVDLIKIDVEGAEYDVLLGATKTINKNHPKLIIENHTKNHKKIKKLLSEWGYNLRFEICELDPDMERYFWIIGEYNESNNL